MEEIAIRNKSKDHPAPLDITLPSDPSSPKRLQCDTKIMGTNLKTLQSLKWEINGVKFYPYASLRLLMCPPKIPVRLQLQRGDYRSVTQMAMLSSFLHDKQLHKMLQTQVPMSMGATIFKDVLMKMNLRPFVHKHLLQTAYLDIAFIQVNPRNCS